MSTLHVFNCDNDLALANFSPGYTPASKICMMMDELSELPLAWWEPPSAFDEKPRPGVGSGEEKVGNVTAVSVWGWSPAVCHRLRLMGAPASLLPTQAQLQQIRKLSSRHRAVELLAQMKEQGVCSAFQSVYCTDESQVRNALGRWPRTILKAPWSGSGKGLRYGQGGREETLRGWYQRILRQQGGVVVEPLYDKLHDLAMEFWSDGEGHVTYQGLSLFETFSNGAYRGNLLLPEAEKEAWLHQFVAPQHVIDVRNWLERHLGQVISTAYRGYLGVDMMLVSPDSSLSSPLHACPISGVKPVALLHPMVEVNLRMTMGMVSVLLQRRLGECFRGVFRLDYFEDPKAQEADNAVRRKCSPSFRILASGAHYRAYIDALPATTSPLT